MKWSEGRIGRIFVIRLEDGDKMPGAVEKLCRSKKIERGLCFFTGGIKSGELVEGPVDGDAGKIEPIVEKIKDVWEMSGAGTIFPDEDGCPRLHMHSSLGRGGKALAGCIRKGVDVWKLGEVVILEIDNNTALRKFNRELGFSLMEP